MFWETQFLAISASLVLKFELSPAKLGDSVRPRIFFDPKIEKLRLRVEKMRGRTESTNFDVLISNFNTRGAEIAKNAVFQSTEKN